MLVFTRKEGRTHAAQVETEAVSTVLCVLPLPCYVIKRATWFFRPSTFGHCCAFFFFLVAESPNAHFFFSVIDCRSRGVALSAAEGAVGIPDSVFFFLLSISFSSQNTHQCLLFRRYCNYSYPPFFFYVSFSLSEPQITTVTKKKPQPTFF